MRFDGIDTFGVSPRHSRNLASFRVVKLGVTAGHKGFYEGFDAHQLH
jgi:hypothetical protein